MFSLEGWHSTIELHPHSTVNIIAFVLNNVNSFLKIFQIFYFLQRFKHNALLERVIVKIFLLKGSNHTKIFFVKPCATKKCPVNDLSQTRNYSQSITSKYPISTKKILQGEGSSSVSCQKYSRTVNPVFHKIYARKWLCTAVCGHNIFLVTISWCRWPDLNCPICFLWFFVNLNKWLYYVIWQQVTVLLLS